MKAVTSLSAIERVQLNANFKGFKDANVSNLHLFFGSELYKEISIFLSY